MCQDLAREVARERAREREKEERQRRGEEEAAVTEKLRRDLNARSSLVIGNYYLHIRNYYILRKLMFIICVGT